MNITRKRTILLVVLAELAALALIVRPGSPRGDDPALVAQRIQQRLFDAQRVLASDPAAARSSVAAAAEQQVGLVTRLPPSAQAAGQAAGQALASAQAAVAAGDQRGLALAQADCQAALLWAGYLATLQAVRANDAGNAAIWLKLRAYPPSSRFNPASSRATLAIQDLAAGRMRADAALAVVQRDLDQGYSALLADALDASARAAGQRFGQRAAESAGLASGYYSILRAGFAERAGAARAAAVDRALTTLRLAAGAGDWAAIQRASADAATALGG